VGSSGVRRGVWIEGNISREEKECMQRPCGRKDHGIFKELKGQGR